MESRVIYALGYETKSYMLLNMEYIGKYMKVIPSVNKDNPMLNSSSG